MPKSESAMAELAAKLLRVAAPTSKAAEQERITAALEAAKIIAEHNLEVHPAGTASLATLLASVAKRKAPHARKAPTQAVRQWINDDWTETTVATTHLCGICRRPILPGEKAWYWQGNYRHYDITCDDAGDFPDE